MRILVMEYDYEYGDYAFNYYVVSLSNRNDYTTQFNIQSTYIGMTCTYNTRSKNRYITLTNKYGDVILPQTAIKYVSRCELNFNAERINLNYYVTLKPKNPTKIFPNNYDYLNWSNDFDLCFVGYENSLNDELDVRGREVLVGN